MEQDPIRPIEKLHKSLVNDGYELPDVQQFEKDMSDDNNRKKLWDNLKSEYELPEFDQFSDDMGFKKKVDSWKKPLKDQLLPGEQSADSSLLPSVSSPEGAPAAEKTSTQEKSLVGKTPEETEALLRANAQEQFNRKKGISTERPVLKKFEPEFYNEIKQSADSLSSIYNKRFELLDKSFQKRAEELRKAGASEAEIQAEADKHTSDFDRSYKKEFDAKMSAITAEKLDKFRNLSEAELKDLNKKEALARQFVENVNKKVDGPTIIPSPTGPIDVSKPASVGKSIVKNIAAITTAGMAASYKNSQASWTKDYDSRLKQDGVGTKQIVPLKKVDKDSYKALLENLMSVDDPENNLATADKITRDALIKTEELISGKDITYDQFKDIFKAKYNSTANEYKTQFIKNAEQQSRVQGAMLADIPRTWDEAKEKGMKAEYAAGSVGEVLGSSLATAGTLGIGGVILNNGEVYERTLSEKAKTISEITGQQYSKEDIIASGQDGDVIEMTENLTPVVAGLDMLGMVTGLGGAAKNVLAKGVVNATIRNFIKNGVKRGAGAIAGRALAASGKAMAYPMLAEVSTEEAQSILPVIGSKIIANKIRGGKTLDESILSFTDEEWDEFSEVGIKTAFGMSGLGSAGSVVSGLRSAATDIETNQKIDLKKFEVITGPDGNQFVVSKEKPRYRVVAKPDGTLVSVVSENTQDKVDTKVDTTPKSTVEQGEIISKYIDDGKAHEFTPEAAESYAKGKDKAMSKIGRVASNLFKVIGKIKSVSPRVVLLTDNESAKSMAASLGHQVESDDKINGWYSRDTNTMFITPNTDTAIHEIMMHPVIDALKQTSPERYSEFIQQVAQLKTEDSAGNKVSFLDKAKVNYKGKSEEEINDEAVVDYLTKIADKGFDSNYLQKIIELFQKYFNVKVGDFDINLDNPTDVKIFAKDLAKALRQARPVVLSKDQAIPTSARVAVDKVKSKESTGVTFNPDFSEYTGDDDVVTLISENVTSDELTPERVAKFKEQNKEVLSQPNTKVGIFDMGDGKYSLDINVTAPVANRAKTLEFAKANNQKAIYSKKEGVIETGGTGETTIKTTEDAISAAKRFNEGPSFSKEYVDNSSKTQEFFSDVVTGKSDKFKPVRPYQPIMKNNKAQDDFNKEYSKFKGNFDEHIATSIPGFRDVQVKKGRAIIDALPNGGLMIDIAGSEGGLNKAITKISNGKIKTINLDVNKDMQAVHEAKPVAGADFKLGAFFNDYEDDGFVAKRWIPEVKADVVHESMGFQFMSPQRDLHIKEVADNYLKPDGMVIVEEKVGNPQWEENEVKKDRDFKSRFYTQQQIEEKNKAVKVSDFDANEGMAGNMVTEDFLLRELGKNFTNVRQYWDSGNFKGYVASNDKAKVDRFIQSMGSTNTEFSNRPDSELVNISSNKNTSFQAEKLVNTKIDSKKPINSTQGVAKFLNTWAKKNNIFGRKNVEKMDDAKAIEILVPQIRQELQAWDEYMSSGYSGFYDEDIIKADEKLRQFAVMKYGRQLTDQEVALFHVLSSFASPSATPEFDSQKGLLLFDRYLRTGEVSPYDYSKDAEVYTTDESGKRVPTGEKKKTESGETVYPQVSVAYASASLDKFNQIVEKVGGPDNAINWISSRHSYEELSDMAGKPTKGPDALKTHEYLSKEDGGYGVFAISGPKLGSYILNRLGNLETVTKDMWYARSMARLFGEPLVDGKTAIKEPWAATTKVGVRKRKIADKAFDILAKERGVTPAVIQQQLWDFEKKLWQQLGAEASKPAYASTGLEKGIEQVYQNRGLMSKAERVAQDNIPVTKALDLVPFSKEKVTKTTERVVAPENSAFENLHNAFDAANPDPRFTGKTQETKKMLEAMSAMTDDEISEQAKKMGSEKLLDMAKSFQGNSNFSLLFLIEQMKRAARSGDDAAVDNTWDAINQVGHTVGQLLAQMRALQSATDNNMIIKKILDRVFKKADVNLNKDQKAELSDLVEEYVITAAEEKKQAEKYDVNRTPNNKSRLDKARQNSREAAEDLQIFIDDHIPETIMDTLGSLLRGNLLSPISLGRNVFGNTLSMAASFTEAGVVQPVANMLADPKNARMLPYWVPIIAGARGGWTTLKTLFPSIADSYFGTHFLPVDDIISKKFEIRRQIRPLRSAKKLFTTLPREVASGEKSIAQGLKEGLQNLLYATAGIPASLMFRALQATDAPFSEGFKAYHDYVEFYSKKQNAGKPLTDLEAYQRNMTEGQKSASEKFARTGLFSDPDSFAASTARRIITQTPKDIAKFTEANFPGFIAGPFNAAMMFVRDAMVPYTTVPSNVVWTLFEYAVPVLPMIESVQQFKKGNKVLASQLMGRALNGVAMYYAASMVVEAGLMIDGDDDRKEKNDKQLKYAVGQPYGLNVDGLARLMSGGDPTRKDSDRIVDARMLGMSGLFLAYYSNYDRKLKESGIEDRPVDLVQNSIDKITIGMSEGTRLALDMSFMMGIETAMTSLFNVDQEAKGMGYPSRMTSQVLDTYSNAIWPNTVSQAFINSNNQGPLSVSQESFGKNITEKMAKKHFFFMKPDDLYPTLDIWGNKIENKEGMKNMVNLWKSRTQRDPVAWEIMRLMDSTKEENPIYIAQPTLEIEDPATGENINLQLGDYDRFILASLSGRFSHMLISASMNDPQYKDMTDAERVALIKENNSEGRKIARDIFESLFLEDLDAGKIVIEDPKKGKYKRVDNSTNSTAKDKVEEIMSDSN